MMTYRVYIERPYRSMRGIRLGVGWQEVPLELATYLNATHGYRIESIPTETPHLETSESETSVIEKGIADDYEEFRKAELEKEARDRGIYNAIAGSGDDGFIYKDDIIAALEADDAAI